MSASSVEFRQQFRRHGILKLKFATSTSAGQKELLVVEGGKEVLSPHVSRGTAFRTRMLSNSTISAA